ncbi:unnamed protein product [Bursaphelenchus xylophilus]|uniref:(pine wood nematode) hypothetical protein n=1 Tax=Bursaphelenchus xylophilus TaxID=6326 RepID=A0A1I7RTD4_BURXY|nr:unnamed protein product [Bursaphelenchus xylophilus]CAG9122493.1 unnamed protein product [Bursaphelenchus xylophilus]
MSSLRPCLARSFRFYSTRRDVYKLLEVSRSATPEEIKDSYYTLSKKYHPDSPTADPKRFLEIKNAYEKLRDRKKTSEENGKSSLHRFTREDLEKVDERFKNYYRSRTVDYKAHKPVYTVKEDVGEYEKPHKIGFFERAVDYITDIPIVIRAVLCASFGIFLGTMTFFTMRMKKMERYRRENPHLVCE